MSLVQVQKRRNASSQQQHSSSSSRSSSSSSVFSTSSSRVQQSSRKAGTSVTRGRINNHDGHMDNSMVKRARSKSLGSRHVESSTTSSVSSSVLVGNLTTDFRKTQERIKVLKEELETENRAYKEALRNSNTCNHDLNNSIAEFNDRQTRLDEVHEVFNDCKKRARGIESDQRLLQNLIIKAKYDGGCAQEAATSLGTTKQDLLHSILSNIDKTSEATTNIENISKNNEVVFNRKQKQYQSDIESKDHQLFQTRTSIANLKERNLALSFTKSENSSLVESLKLELSTTDNLHSKHKDKTQKLKVEIENLKKQFQADQSLHNKEVKVANSQLSAATSTLLKVTNDESRQSKQKTSFEEENNSKDQKLKSNNVDFSSKLNSLKGTIESLEVSYALFKEKIDGLKSSLNVLKRENSSVKENAESCQETIDKETLLLMDMEEKVKTLADSNSEEEAKAKFLQDQRDLDSQSQAEALNILKGEIDQLEENLVQLEKNKKDSEAQSATLEIQMNELLSCIESAKQDSETFKMTSKATKEQLLLDESKHKELAQNSEAVLITLHLEEKELVSSLAGTESQLTETQQKVEALLAAADDLNALSPTIRGELLPEHEIEEIKLEVLKRQDLPSQQHELSDIDQQILEEKSRHQMFNERKNTIRNNSTVKLEAELSKLTEMMEADSKAIELIQSDLNSFDEQSEDSNSEIDEDDEDVVELKRMIDLTQKNESEIDDILNEIEQITITMAEAKKAEDKVKLSETSSHPCSIQLVNISNNKEKDAGTQPVTLSPRATEDNKPTTNNLEPTEIIVETQEQDNYPEQGEFLPSSGLLPQQCSLDCIPNKKQHLFTSEQQVDKKKMTLEPSLTNTEDNEVFLNDVEDDIFPQQEHHADDFNDFDEGGISELSAFPNSSKNHHRHQAPMKTPSSNIGNKVPKPQKPKKNKGDRSFHHENKKESKKQSKMKKNRQLSSSSQPSSSAIDSGGPHVIVGEEDEEDMGIPIKHVNRSKKQPITHKLPVLVPLDEKYSSSASPPGRSKGSSRPSSNKTNNSSSARGVSRSRSPLQNAAKSFSKSKSKKVPTKVKQETDWLFSSQEGFSF